MTRERLKKLALELYKPKDLPPKNRRLRLLLRQKNSLQLLYPSTKQEYKDNSFIIPLCTNIFPDSKDTSNFVKILFDSLLDSSSTHGFMDKAFVYLNSILMVAVSALINLCLFDGSLAPNPITEIVELQVLFPTSELLPLTFMLPLWIHLVKLF